MMASAKRVLPGVVMSMLLATPALAGHGTSHRAAGAELHGGPAHRLVAGAAHRTRPARAGARARFASPRSADDTASPGYAEDAASRATFDPEAAPPLGAAVFSARYDSVAPAPDGEDYGPSARDARGAYAQVGHRLAGHGLAGHGLVGQGQVGMASWYGGTQWHGHMTSSGERFDQDALTAAHATLPLGSLVRVSTLDGAGSVVVRITDRPGTRRRVIDLSRGAARALGILSRGVAMVSLQPQ